ncbi:MAG TPA: hypothetical protein VF553_16400 [Pyrinomonadaceae bacterium]|jgi:hypothetical protein
MVQKRAERQKEVFTQWAQQNHEPVITPGGTDTLADQASVVRNPFFGMAGSPLSAYRFLAYVRTGTPEYAVLSLALSKDGTHWAWWKSNSTTGAPEPVLKPGDSGTTNRLNSPHALFHQEKMYVWSSLYDGAFKICLATSADGFTFGEKITVLKANTNSTAFDSLTVQAPTVLLEGEKVRMWYIGGKSVNGEKYYSLGLAEYDSLTATTPSYRSDALFPAPGQTMPDWTKRKIGFPRIVRYGGKYLLFFCGQETTDAWMIGLAESDDGLVWKMSKEEPILTPSEGAWNSFTVYSPSVLIRDTASTEQASEDRSGVPAAYGAFMYFGGSDSNTTGAKAQTGVTWSPLVS